LKINLEVGQKWISDTHPHEDFEIYDVIVQEWDNHPTEVFYCWKRINEEAFKKYVEFKKGMTIEELYAIGKNYYPYAWYGETKRSNIIRKIKKYNMKLTK
jgi:hypothetical protein